MLDTSKHSVWGFSFYHWVDSLEKLKLEWLPPHEAFYSKLKQECISDEDYEFCKHVWLEEGMRTMCDFLVQYSNCDMKLFLKAFEARSRSISRKRSICSRQVFISLEQPSVGCWSLQTRVETSQERVCGWPSYKITHVV